MESNDPQQATVIASKRFSPLQNYSALLLALGIDFFDAVPVEALALMGLIPVPIGYEAGISVVEAAYLNHLGVPIVNLLVLSGIDLIPFVDIIPWCTLAVLDTRFNVKIPYVTKLFNLE